MIVVEIMLSLVVGMWMISLIILPTNKLTELNGQAEIDIKRNANISKVQKSLYDNIESEIHIDYKNIDNGIYDTSSEKRKEVLEGKTYVSIRDEKSYYLKGDNKQDRIFKSRKWKSGKRTMESVLFSKNQLETELERYLTDIERKTGNLLIEDIEKSLKNEKFSFNNPISKVDIEDEDKKDASVSFITVLEIIKEIDKWKVYYVLKEGNIDLEYVDGSIDLEMDYETYGTKKKFALDIFKSNYK